MYGTRRIKNIKTFLNLFNVNSRNDVNDSLSNSRPKLHSDRAVSIFQFERVFVYEIKVNPRRGLDTVYNPHHAKLSFSYYNSRILHDT